MVCDHPSHLRGRHRRRWSHALGRKVCGLFIVGLIACLGEPTSARRVEVLQAKAFPDPDLKSRAARVFLTLRSGGGAATLKSVKMPDGVAELRTHVFENARPQTPVLPELQLPPDRDIHMRPGGIHLLATPDGERPRSGDRLRLVLVFADGSEQPLTVPVRALPRQKAQDSP